MPGLKDTTVERAQHLDCDLYNDFEQLKRDRANEHKRHNEALEQLKKQAANVSLNPAAPKILHSNSSAN